MNTWLYPALSGRPLGRLVFLLSLVLVFGACKKKPPLPTPQPSTPVSAPETTKPAEPEPVSPPEIIIEAPEPMPTPLELADEHFRRQELGSAVEGYTVAMESGLDSFESRQLLQAALALVSDTDLQDVEKARLVLAELSSRVDAGWRESATLLLALLDRQVRLNKELGEKARKVVELSAELEKLKEIDLRRRPGRPPDDSP